MPPPEDDGQYRPQSVLLFAATGASDGYGVPLVGAVPSEVKVRWVDKVRVVPDANGNTVSVDGTVVTVQAVPLQSVIWKGGLDDLPGTAELPTSAFKRVVADLSVPDLKGRVTRYEYGFVRSGETMPPTA